MNMVRDKKRIKNSIAFVIDNINKISHESPGKKTLQKIVFLIEKKGINLNCEYGLHFYGPYSATLDAQTSLLDDFGVIDFDYSGLSHRMKVNEKCDIESELSTEQEDIVLELIERFKDRTPSELELLTTAIYAYENLEDKSKLSVINGVKKIKGNKYSEEQIKMAFDDFEYFNIKI